VLAELRELGPVAAVHGNVDSPELRRELPEALTLDLEDVTLAVIHDAGPAKGRLERLRVRFPDADAVVFGHSHIRCTKCMTASRSSIPAALPCDAGRPTAPWARPR
jgi:predicted phosphodiesterase